MEAKDARERIQKLLVTGDNRLKQGVDPDEGARELGAGARGRAGGGARGGGAAARRGQARRPADASRLRIASTRSACERDVVRRRRPRARPRSGAAARRRPRARRASASTSSGSTRIPASGGTNSGGPPMRVATTERPQAIASSSAWPSGSIRLGWQRTWLVGEQARDLVVRDTADEARRRRGLRAVGRSGPSPTNVSVPSSSCANASASRTTFLRSVERADAEEARRPVRRAAATPKRSRSTPTRHDLRLPARVRHLRLELAAQVVGDADHGRRAAHDEARRRGDAGDTRRRCARRARAR